MIEKLEKCYWDLTDLKTEMGPQMKKVYEAVQTCGGYRGVQFQPGPVPTLETERAKVIGKRNLVLVRVCKLAL